MKKRKEAAYVVFHRSLAGVNLRARLANEKIRGLLQPVNMAEVKNF
jgi:hypothetical protein